MKMFNFELESKLDLRFDVKFDGECDGVPVSFLAEACFAVCDRSNLNTSTQEI